MDGGGIRGLITAILLERLEQARPGFLSMIDLFAGTSTGGLLALGLASGRTPTQANVSTQRANSPQPPGGKSPDPNTNPTAQGTQSGPGPRSTPAPPGGGKGP